MGPAMTRGRYDVTNEVGLNSGRAEAMRRFGTPIIERDGLTDAANDALTEAAKRFSTPSPDGTNPIAPADRVWNMQADLLTDRRARARAEAAARFHGNKSARLALNELGTKLIELGHDPARRR